LIEDTELSTGRGGNAGRGTFGSSPTRGGLPGAPFGGGSTGEKAGEDGGKAGVSTNGAAGLSCGVLHIGTAPKMKGGGFHLGRGGNGVDARSQRDALGNEKTIPATPSSVAQQVLAL
jgi:hypothetical protein